MSHIKALTLGPIAITLNFKYPNSSLMSHSLLSNAHDLGVILAERYSLYSGWEFPGVE